MTTVGPLDELWDELRSLRSELARVRARQHTVFSATVVSVDPVRIRIDGEPDPVAATPDALIPAGPGERVRVLHYDTTHMIIGRIGGLGAMLLDAQTLPEDQREATLRIPQHLRGRFERYEIDIAAGAATTTAAGVRPLSVYINGDTDTSYRATATATDGNGNHIAGQALGISGFPVMAYLGSFAGQATITLTPNSPRGTAQVGWSATGWVNNGSSDTGNYLFTSGGRWLGSTPAAITHFLLRTNAVAATFTDYRRARLWGYR